MGPGPRGLAPAAKQHEDADGHDEQPVAHVARFGSAGGAVAAAVVLPVPALPVLPGGVVGGGAGLRAPRAVGIAVGRIGHVGVAAPTCAVKIVCAPLGRVREDVVGRDDEAVTLQLCLLGDGSVEVRGVGVAVWVVELDELVEGLLAVRGGLGLVEDLVRGWILGLGPRRRCRVVIVTTRFVSRDGVCP